METSNTFRTLTALMRIGILSFNITAGSGQSRFAINLSRGLVKEGKRVTLFAYYCSSEYFEILRKYGIEVLAYKSKLNTIDIYRSISDSRKVFFEMLKMLKGAERCDYYLVLSDELVGISKYRNDEKWIYLSNGDLTLLFMNKRFLDEHYPYSYILKKRFVTQMLKHQKRVAEYDYLFGNSRFAQSIMSFILNTNFTDYIYPPVDTDFFRPKFRNGEENYALVLLRNNSEPMIETIQRIAKAVPIKIVGEAKVNGAVTLGRISEDDLVEVYSNATLTIGSSNQEFFGYATAESLACGTPVIAFRQGAAVEMIEDNINGWLVQNDRELLNRLDEIFKHEYDKSLRKEARKTSERFSIYESSKKFITLIQ